MPPRARTDEPFAAQRGLVRVALETDVAPAPGALDPPFRWEDVLDGLPPGERERGPPRYCVVAGEIFAGTWRVEDAVVVIAHEGGDVEVEDRLCVTRRALAGMLHAEREVVGARLDQAQQAGDAAAHRGREAARRLARRSPPLGQAAHWLVAALHQAASWMLGGARGVTRGLAALPDRVEASARRARALLATPEGRKRIWLGLQDPRTLDRHDKAVTLFLGTLAILGTLLLVHLVVTLATPWEAVPWRATVALFVYGYVSSVGIPLPWEPALIAGTLALGPWQAIAVAIVAKLVAGYMVFFVGDEVNEKLEARAARSPRFARFVAWSERFARRFGVLAMALFIATPGLPDAIALYVFGSLRMPIRRYLLGIAIGAFVLDVAVVFGVLKLLHL